MILPILDADYDDEAHRIARECRERISRGSRARELAAEIGLTPRHRLPSDPQKPGVLHLDLKGRAVATKAIERQHQQQEAKKAGSDPTRR